MAQDRLTSCSASTRPPTVSSPPGGWPRPEKWTLCGGWMPEPNAQLDIQHLGEFFTVDTSEVLDIQAQMLVSYMEYQ